jgi:hypothetical protein
MIWDTLKKYPDWVFVAVWYIIKYYNFCFHPERPTRKKTWKGQYRDTTE